MGTEANKAAAIAIVEGVAKGRVERTLMSDDAVWWMQGRREEPIDVFAASVPKFHATFMEGEGRMEIRGVTAEGDRVALETEIFAPLKKGGVYNATYHFLVQFRDGKAIMVKEYFDTLRARDTFRTGT